MSKEHRRVRGRAYHEDLLECVRIDSRQVEDRIGDDRHQRRVDDRFQNLLQQLADPWNEIGEAGHFMFVLNTRAKGTDEKLPLNVVSAHFVQTIEEPFGEPLREDNEIESIEGRHCCTSIRLR